MIPMKEIPKSKLQDHKHSVGAYSRRGGPSCSAKSNISSRQKSQKMQLKQSRLCGCWSATKRLSGRSILMTIFAIPLLLGMLRSAGPVPSPLRMLRDEASRSNIWSSHPAKISSQSLANRTFITYSPRGEVFKLPYYKKNRFRTPWHKPFLPQPLHLLLPNESNSRYLYSPNNRNHSEHIAQTFLRINFNLNIALRFNLTFAQSYEQNELDSSLSVFPSDSILKDGCYPVRFSSACTPCEKPMPSGALNIKHILSLPANTTAIAAAVKGHRHSNTVFQTPCELEIDSDTDVDMTRTKRILYFQYWNLYGANIPWHVASSLDVVQKRSFKNRYFVDHFTAKSQEIHVACLLASEKDKTKENVVITDETVAVISQKMLHIFRKVDDPFSYLSVVFHMYGREWIDNQNRSGFVRKRGLLSKEYDQESEFQNDDKEVEGEENDIEEEEKRDEGEEKVNSDVTFSRREVRGNQKNNEGYLKNNTEEGEKEYMDEIPEGLEERRWRHLFVKKYKDDTAYKTANVYNMRQRFHFKLHPLQNDISKHFHEMISADVFIGASANGLATLIAGLSRGVALFPKNPSHGDGLKRKKLECCSIPFNKRNGEFPLKNATLFWKAYSKANLAMVQLPTSTGLSDISR